MKALKEIELIKKVYEEKGRPNNEVQAFALSCLMEYKKQFTYAWYCKIITANGESFEIVTGNNEMDVAVKLTEKFGKEIVYNLIDKYNLI